jgi:RNA polymerase sigma-70 factor (ECF subfamily)
MLELSQNTCTWGATLEICVSFCEFRAMQSAAIGRTEQSLEAELVRDARQGVEQAFLAIYDRHRSSVFQFAWRLTGSQSAAEDIAQECFLTMVTGTAFDGNRGALRAYLYGIVRNLVLRRLRRSGHEAEEPVEAAARVDVLGDLLAAERSELVARAVAQLPMLRREAIILFTFDELSLEEIATITGVDAGAVKSRLHRARESLSVAFGSVPGPWPRKEKFMREPDSLDALLREEWKSPEPSVALDNRVTNAYRTAVRPSAWRQFWRFRVSIPAPLLLAAGFAALGLFLWLRPAPVPASSPRAGSVVTQLNATGFQPLPNGEARIIPTAEVRK